jgi:hypothetical protein
VVWEQSLDVSGGRLEDRHVASLGETQRGEFLVGLGATCGVVEEFVDVGTVHDVFDMVVAGPETGV